MSQSFDIKRVLLQGVGFFALFWIGDVLIDMMFFPEASHLAEAVLAEGRELYMRSLSAFLLALLFIVVSALGHRTRRVENALKNSDDLSRIFFESTQHGICVIETPAMTVSDTNAIFLQKLGIEEAETVGCSFGEIVTRQGIPETMVLQVRETAATGTPAMGEMCYCGRDGRKRYAEINTFPIGDGEPEVERVLLVLRDVTRRKTSEALLQDSEARYRSIFDNTGTAVAIISPDGTLKMVNRGFEAATGLGRDEIEGKKRWSEFVSAESLEAIRAHRLRQVGDDGHRQSMELEMLDGSGGTRPMVGNWAAIAGSEEVVLSLMDISDQKRVEEALRESRAALNVAQRMAHLGNWEWDLTSDTQTWSEEMYRIFQVDPEGFTPSHDWAVQAVHIEDREMVTRAVNDAIYNRKALDVEFRIMVAGGAVKTVVARAEVTYDADGTPLRMVGTNLDVSSRIDAEQALRSSEEKFSKAFRASPDAIVITRAEDGRYIDVNRAFEEVTGYSRDEVIGRTSTDLGLWADVDGRMVMLRLLNQYGHVHNLDVRFRVKSGEIRELLWSAEVVEYRGEACLIAISRDVTEQRRLEKDLLESDARLYLKHEELKNLFQQMEGIRREWEETMDCISDMFILADQWGKIRRFNRAVENFSGKAHRDIVGRDWREFLEEVGLKAHLEAPGLALLHAGSGRCFVIKRHAFPTVEIDGSSREVIIINDATATGPRPLAGLAAEAAADSLEKTTLDPVVTASTPH
jgi:PAS domain S-box-containing protein